MTDGELVRRALEGDAGAFDQLVGRHQAAVYRAALAATRVPEDAEDVAQEALVRAWSSLRSFRGEASFRTWLLTIVWRRAMTRRQWRAAWRRRRATLDDARDVAALGARADETVRDRELGTHIRRAIDTLTPVLRDALLLVQSGEYDYGEIAAMLGVPTGTVKWRVSEARRKVRARLAALGYVDAR